MGEHDCLVLVFLDPQPSRASLLHIRRIKTVAPHLRVGVMICQMPPPSDDTADLLTIRLADVAPETLQVARDIGADFAVSTLGHVIAAAFSQDPPLPVTPTGIRRRQPQAPRQVAAAT